MIDTLILDRGHATLDKKGKYITPGKQALLPNGKRVYEGLENQRYVEALAVYAKEAGFKVEYTVKPDDPSDPPLFNRVLTANNSKSRKTSLFLSIHNNAGGGKGEGTELFTNIGQSLSDKFADGIYKSILSAFPDRKIRADLKDGDFDKEELFYVLRKTNMPAVLIEYGFFDNPKDYEWLSSQLNINGMAKATIEGIVDTLIALYGKEAWETRNF